MRSKNELIIFLNKEVNVLLEKLHDDSAPLWGTMDAQRMLEHLALAVKIANGKISIPLSKIEERAAKLKSVFLLTDKPLPREFKNPIIPIGLQPHEHKTLSIAKIKLQEEISLFHHYFQTNGDDAKCVHNLFGELNYHEWLWFQYKHIMHHFMQFGLVPVSEKII